MYALTSNIDASLRAHHTQIHGSACWDSNGENSINWRRAGADGGCRGRGTSVLLVGALLLLASGDAQATGATQA